MRTVDLIRKKRDGGELTRDEIKFLVDGCTSGAVPDYQLSAWLMATLIRGMTKPEIAALTEAMLHSGEVLDLSPLPGKKWTSIQLAASATRPRSSLRRPSLPPGSTCR